MSLSRRELEDLKPMIDKAVQVFLGFSEPTLVTVAINCVDKGYDQRKTADKLLSYLDERQAKTFTEKLFSTYSEFKSLGKHGRSRKRKEDRYEEVAEPKKQKKTEDAIPAAPVPEPGNPSPGQLTNDKIKEMMANAQRMISQRKAQLGVPEVPVNISGDLLRRQTELQSRIQSQMMNVGLGGDSVAAALAAAAQKQAQAQAQQAQSKPTPLILDEQGRTIDAKTGETIQLQQHMPTLKANIRAKRREQFKAVQDKAPEVISESKFFDPRVGEKAAVRTKRGFRFHDEGKFVGLASKLRTKALLEKLQNEIASAAKKTGIASAAKLATIQPKKDLQEGEIPDVEWWDCVILQAESYESYFSAGKKGSNRFEGITNLIEHPTQMRAPAEPTKLPKIDVVLTKKERKKLRRQGRLETQKELQEKIRLGLIPPPEPKVRMANLMRVLVSF
jgi:U4/U6 small nuclear ribonucleoprotein PRP3